MNSLRTTLKTSDRWKIVYLTDDFDETLGQFGPSGKPISALPQNLLWNITTDHIITVADILTNDLDHLGDSALCGYGLSKGMLRKSGANVLVAGGRFGSGSSREQAVWALMKAGVKIVLAPSFGPIFRRNAAYLGLLISTDIELAAKLHDNSEVCPECFLDDHDQLHKAIIRAGGLFSFLHDRDSVATRIYVKDSQLPAPAAPMTVYEQRLARALGAHPVKPGASVLLLVDVVYSYVGLSGLARSAILEAYGGIPATLGLAVERIHLYEDHFALSKREIIQELTEDQRRFGLAELRIPNQNYHFGTPTQGPNGGSGNGGSGICHRDMLERLDPRVQQVVVATDSHTPTLGALPLLAIPVGSTLFAAAIVEGKIPYSIASTTRVELSGKLHLGTSIRDAQLELAAHNKQKSGDATVIEFGGPGLHSLSMDQVVALCNMVPEVFNAEVAVTEAFSAGVQYLQEKFSITQEEAYDLYGMPGENCEYQAIVHYNLDQTSPWIALPGSPRNGVPLIELEEHEIIHKAYLVSCILGVDDLVDAAAVLLNQEVHADVELIVTPSSRTVRRLALELGVLPILRQAGATITDLSACSTCIGEGPGSIGKGEVGITASNRNFRGRMGHPEGRVYLAGPILTALAAIYGRVPTIAEYRSNIARVEANVQKLRRI